jgi:hypothetical protein
MHGSCIAETKNESWQQKHADTWVMTIDTGMWINATEANMWIIATERGAWINGLWQQKYTHGL